MGISSRSGSCPVPAALSPFAGDFSSAGVVTLLGNKELESSAFLSPRFFSARANPGWVIKSGFPAQVRVLQHLQITAGRKNLGIKLSVGAGLKEFGEFYGV